MVVIGDKRNVYLEVVAKCERNKQLGRPGRRCDDMLKYILMKFDGRL